MSDKGMQYWPTATDALFLLFRCTKTRGIHRCSRNRSGQSTLEQFRTTTFNNMAATHSFQTS